MKVVKILALMVCVGMMALLPQAQAAILSVAPSGSFDATGITTITYDINFNVAAGESFNDVSWLFELNYDGAEIDYAGSQPVFGEIGSDFSQYPFITPVDDSSLLFDNFLGAVDYTPGNHLLASVTFNIIDLQFFDNNADLSVLSFDYNGLYGMFDNLTFEYIQTASANGADIGAPVPIPGAIWLLGSGLVALIGFRRRPLAG
ncbi:MAG: hypothetical protein C4519_15855 [Desulfobacteraceae bacterium]|nr:MAG: hypothetical protein C4519_15855 [Desulfobacteraceae bacterium]